MTRLWKIKAGMRHPADASIFCFVTTEYILYLELGVGYNTPGIIKYPFFSMTAEDKDNLYVCINTSDMRVPDLIRDRAVCIKGDIGEVLDQI